MFINTYNGSSTYGFQYYNWRFDNDTAVLLPIEGPHAILFVDFHSYLKMTMRMHKSVLLKM